MIEERIMDRSQEGTQIASHLGKTKFPTDLRIVVYLLYAVGFIQLLIGVLLTIGVGSTEGYTQRVLCGTVLLSTDTAWATYMFCAGLAHVLCAWGLIRKEKLAWWCALLLSICYLIDHMLLFPKQGLVALICVIIDLGIITCLWFRRNVYDIGLEAKNS
jgi:uncharacterized membrane protein